MFSPPMGRLVSHCKKQSRRSKLGWLLTANLFPNFLNGIDIFLKISRTLISGLGKSTFSSNKSLLQFLLCSSYCAGCCRRTVRVSCLSSEPAVWERSRKRHCLTVQKREIADRWTGNKRGILFREMSLGKMQEMGNIWVSNGYYSFFLRRKTQVSFLHEKCFSTKISTECVGRAAWESKYVN